MSPLRNDHLSPSSIHAQDVPGLTGTILTTYLKMATDRLSTITTDYSKLTVPQLKAICKERRITGYSKLGKAALLEKLVQHTASATSFHSRSPVGNPSPLQKVARPGEAPEEESIPRQTPSPAQPPLHTSENGLLRQGTRSPGNNSSGINLLHGQPESTALLPINKSNDPALLIQTENNVSVTQEATSSITKRKKKTKAPEASLPTSFHPNLKRTKLSDTPKTSQVLDLHQSAVDVHPLQPYRLPSSPANPELLKTPDAQTSISPDEPSARPLTTDRSHTKSKRFVPLVVQAKKASIQSFQSVTNAEASHKSLLSLDFTSSVLPTLRPIDMPPSLSERKHVQAWSIVLSGISDRDRRQCSLVSRMFRYAVYLSAHTILSRSFGGRRLTYLNKCNNPNMFNYWPILKHLDEENKSFHGLYKRSMLARFFGKHMPIAERVWNCPDHQRQLTLVIRFLMTRVWLAIMVPLNSSERTTLFSSVVTDAQEIIKDEIWVITTRDASNRITRHEESYCVLEATCEVIGRRPEEKLPASFNSTEPFRSNSSSVHQLATRVDWTSYIEHRLMPNGFHDVAPPSLISFLKWSNSEEYDQGISKNWLSRVQKEDRLGIYKKIVAQRYVLACVVNNSVSGEWMTASRMAQSFSGSVPTSGSNLPSRGKVDQKVNLFLPAHHLVESVHFATSKGRPLHSAIASVQTPGREYFILRENGMEIGCEEDGIWSPWTELLCCDDRGLDLQAHTN